MLDYSQVLSACFLQVNQYHVGVCFDSNAVAMKIIRSIDINARKVLLEVVMVIDDKIV